MLCVFGERAVWRGENAKHSPRLNQFGLKVMALSEADQVGANVDVITSTLGLAAIGLFGFCMIFAAFRDITSFTIPNWISLALVGGFLLVGWWAMPLHLFGQHLLVGFGILTITIIMFALRWVGGGDAKLFAAGSLWMGWEHLPEYVAYTAMLGGALTLALMLFRAMPFLPARVIVIPWVGDLIDREKDVPYGVAIAAGGLLVLPQTVLFAGLS